jgi:hypothetical protein
MQLIPGVIGLSVKSAFRHAFESFVAIRNGCDKKLRDSKEVGLTHAGGKEPNPIPQDEAKS